MGNGLRLWSGKPNTRHYTQHATHGSFKAGDPVYLVTGKLKIATDGANVSGIAGKDAVTGTAATADIPIFVVTPEQVWSIYADTATTPALATHAGNDYNLAISAGDTRVNLTADGDDVVVEDLDSRDTAAAGTRVLVRFIAASCDLLVG